MKPGVILKSLIMALLLVGLPFAPLRADDGIEIKVDLVPDHPRQGGIMVVRIQINTEVDDGGCWGEAAEKEIFFAVLDDRTCEALVGIDVDMEPGEYPITVGFINPDMNYVDRSWRGTFTVEKGRFEEQHLSVNSKFTEYDAQTEARIEREEAVRDEAYTTLTPGRLWSEPFIKPVEGAVTGRFGTRRFFNNIPKLPHNGVDFGVGFGTEIKAANAGLVLLTGEFFFNGRFVYLDHGLGLFTMYLHLSEILVKDGDLVARGQVIGRVGSTGRVTGPHLHWGARLWDSRIDPLELLNLMPQPE